MMCQSILVAVLGLLSINLGVLKEVCTVIMLMQGCEGCQEQGSGALAHAD